MAKPKVLLIHGVAQQPGDNWYPWLKNELERKDFQVFVPALPGEWQPDCSTWRKIILEMSGMDENTIVVGHSLGALLGLRLAEKYKFNKLILIAGWDFNTLAPHEQSFWPQMTNHARIKENVQSRVVVTSDNDPWITATVAKEMAERLEAEYLLVPRAGHFLEQDGAAAIPELMKFL